MRIRSTPGARIAALFVLAVGCSPADDTVAPEHDAGAEPAWCAPPTCPVDTTGIDLSMPVVSFDAALFGEAGGILRVSCNLVTCHGMRDLAKGGLYLGPSLSDTTTVIDDALRAEVHANLLKASLTSKAMVLVKPGAPEQSLLMLKVDGCQALATPPCSRQAGAECSGACGDPMPQKGVLLTSDERHTIRRWIAQGALNN